MTATAPDTRARAVERALEDLTATPDLALRIVHVRELPARHPVTRDPARPLHTDTRAALARIGIDDFWAHQSTAVDAVLEGRSVVLSTGTASGKSLAWVAPLLEGVHRAGEGKAAPTSLLLFPTKALARDQLRRLHELAAPMLEPMAVDGDTPRGERDWARHHANVVLTNPDMLHGVLLPQHPRWAGFLRRLHLVAVDELHTQRGVFGSHVAHVLRRLRRIAAHHGADPVMVCASATLGAPEEHARSITGTPVLPVTEDTAPASPTTVVVWNPPLIDPDEGIRMSPISEAAMVLARLVRNGLQTLAFARSRKAAELVAKIAREQLGSDPLAERIVCYRGGFLADDRREIERNLADGTIRGLAATNALELGMDVGGLDAVVLCGFPGTVASFRQQIGRAGRGTAPSLAVLVAGQDQLDQWYTAHPDELFDREPERAVVSPENPYIAEPHLACAAYELPLRRREPYIGEDMDARAGPLVADGILRIRRGRLYVTTGSPPARHVPIRSSGRETFTIRDVDEDRVIGDVESGRAFRVVHPGAVYLHQGETYLVEHLDLDTCEALVRATNADHYTEPRTETDITIDREDASVPLGKSGVTLSLGSVEVVQQVVGYRRRAFQGAITGPINGSAPASTQGDGSDGAATSRPVPLDLPPQTLETRAFWYTIPPDLVDDIGIDPADLPGVVHACEHAGIGILPLFAICDRWDLGGVSMVLHPQTGAPTWFIYDAYPGGAGMAEAGFRTGMRHVEATWQVIDDCPCVRGCPSCVQSPKCGNWNDPLDKDGAARLLRAVFDAP